MKVLTIKQPWAWAIIHAGKDVENRTWSTTYRGPLLIHAGKAFDNRGADFITDLGIDVPDTFNFGGIIGSVEIVDVSISSSPWAIEGFQHWRLSKPKRRKFIQITGQLGLWEVDTRKLG